jgi:hypothetical protein
VIVVIVWIGLMRHATQALYQRIIQGVRGGIHTSIEDGQHDILSGCTVGRQRLAVVRSQP